ncbi:MAG: hypothetical protein IJX14_08870 [Clostridia bacterium]|nr:hypothetical protein [Clostridia bacterium]
MVRGCQKRIYYIKNPRSALFAEAYFILKAGEGRMPGEDEMAKEARRIVADLDHTGRHPSRPVRDFPAGQKLGAFVIGAASSSAVIGGIALLLAFA